MKAHSVGRLQRLKMDMCVCAEYILRTCARHKVHRKHRNSGVTNGSEPFRFRVAITNSPPITVIDSLNDKKPDLRNVPAFDHKYVSYRVLKYRLGPRFPWPFRPIFFSLIQPKPAACQAPSSGAYILLCRPVLIKTPNPFYAVSDNTDVHFHRTAFFTVYFLQWAPS